MDEEFFFPQNVRTEYRLWIFGPRHLRRLPLVLIPAVLVVWLTHEFSTTLAAVLAVLVASVHCTVYCLPVLHDEETVWDLWQEMLRHRDSQTRFEHGGRGGIRHGLGPEEGP